MSEPSIQRKRLYLDVRDAQVLRVALLFGEGQPGGADIRLGAQNRRLEGSGSVDLQAPPPGHNDVIEIMAVVQDVRIEHNRTSLTVAIARDDEPPAVERTLACEAPCDDGQVIYDVAVVLYREGS